MTLTFPAGAVSEDTAINISPVPAGFTPGALPDTLEPALIITIQPSGLTFDQPVGVEFPNVDALPEGSLLDLWSLDHGTGEFFISGTGQVSGGVIETVSGGITAASWHFSLPRAATVVAADDRDGDDSDPRRCTTCEDVASTLIVPSGAILTDLSTPAYVSQNQARALSFVYQSNRALPSPLLPFEPAIPVGTAVPQTLSHSAALGGIAQPGETFLDATGLNAGEAARAAASLDGTAVDTGLYPARVRVTSRYAVSRVSSVLTEEVFIVNERASAFGIGWSLTELRRIHPLSNGDVLLVEGDGSFHRFANEPIVTPVADFPDFADQSDLVLNGQSDAVNPVSGSPVLRLTETQNPGVSAAGSAFLADSVALELEGIGLSFDTAFEFKMSDPTGGNSGCDNLKQGGHGLTFAIAADPTGLGEHSEGIGFAEVVGIGDARINPSVVVEFDSAGNDGDPFCGCCQIPGPDIGINLDGDVFSEVAVSDPGPAMNPQTGPVSRFAWVDYDGFQEILEVRYSATNDKSTAPVILSHSIDLLDHFAGQPVHFGFTSGINATKSNTHDILAWTLDLITPDSGPTIFTSPEGNFTTLIRNANGSFTQRLEDGTEIQFDASGRQTAVVDRNGNPTSYGYDQGRLISIMDPVGRVTSLAYVDGLLSSVTDPASRVTAFEHDNSSRLVRVTFPDATTREFSYDLRHLMVGETNARGFTTAREFDASGRFARATLPDGAVREATNAQAFGFVDLGSGEGSSANPAAFERAADAVSTLTDAEGRLTTFETGAFGAATAITDAAGLVTDLQRDADGNATQRDDPSGHTTSATYDALGNLLTLTDHVLSADPVLEPTLALAYEPNFSQVESITDGRGNTTTLSHDGQGNVTRIESPVSVDRDVTLTYETDGLPATLTDVLGTVTTFGYDPTTRQLTSVEEGTGLAQPRQTALSYTPEGYLDTITDPAARVVDFDYDPMGRVTRIELPDLREVLLDYDAAGNLISLTPPGRSAHLFDYDEREQESLYDPPQPAPAIPNPETTFDYNDENQLTLVTRPDGLTLALGYDPAGRLATISSPLGTQTLAYGGLTGLLDGVTDLDGGQLTFAYDGNLRTQTTWSGEVSGDVAVTYDPDGRIETRSVNGAQTAAFGYDGDGLVTQAGALAITRDPATGFIDATALEGVTSAPGFNAFGELESEAFAAGPMALYDLALVRDALGRVTRKVESVGMMPATTTDYTYDPAGRLDTVTVDSVPVRDFEYDANSNRTSLDGGASTIASYDAQDRLLTHGTLSFTYTDNGELLTKTDTSSSDQTSYAYDVFGNLRSVALPNGTTVSYVIDAANRRVGKRLGGMLVQGFLYGDALNPVAELGPNGMMVVSRFVYGTRPHVPDYLVKGGMTYRIISDHLGSVRLVVDAMTGAPVQQLAYDEWGNVSQDTNPGFQPFGFAGGLYDPDTGLVRFGARDYDPAVGRWTAKDPIRFDGDGPNLFAYALGDPVNLTDKTGRGVAGTLACIGIGAIVAGLDVAGAERLGEDLAAIDKKIDQLEETCPAPGREAEFFEKKAALHEEKREVVQEFARAKAISNAVGFGVGAVCAAVVNIATTPASPL